MSTPARRRNGARPPTVSDVARLADVSAQTVSRVLNAHPRVSPEARGRVERAIKQLNYRPNSSARALRTRRTMKLGVVAVGTEQWGIEIALFGVAEAARRAGYATSLVTLDRLDRASMRAALDHLTVDAVEGIVVIAPITAAANAVEGLSVDVPLVAFEPGVHNGTTFVAVDEVLGARHATRHLLELGHETVWHVAGPPGWLATDARIEGWRKELAASRRVANEVIVGDWSAASGYRAGQEIAREEDVSAVFVANDQMALGVLKALREAGRAVPEDVSVIGFDDIPEAAFYQPSLTTVRLDFAEVGRRCVRRILSLIAGTALTPEAPVLPELVVRDSTSPPGR